MIRGRRQPRDTVSMNLFPFLAVLICTMGSLIALLVVMVQQARAKATPPAPLPPPVAVQQQPADDFDQRLAEHNRQKQLAAKTQQEIEDVEWRASLLRESYAKTVKEMADQRLALSHIENHTRKLSEQAAKMQAEANLIAKLAEEKSANQQQADQTLVQLQDQIASAKDKLEDAKQKIANRRTTYSLVPYDGPNGTHRRPIYIECLGDRVVMQPENVVFVGEDFREPLTNGNPLASALRAKREYLVEQGLLANGEEPYPLLVVRPGSAASYAAARSAMTSWEAEFGYELVEQGIELDYAARDPSLGRLLNDVVEEAREQRRFMLAVRQSQRNTRQREVLRPSAQGGFESVGGSGGQGGSGNADDTGVPFQTAGNNRPFGEGYGDGRTPGNGRANGRGNSNGQSADYSGTGPFSSPINPEVASRYGAGTTRSGQGTGNAQTTPGSGMSAFNSANSGSSGTGRFDGEGTGNFQQSGGRNEGMSSDLSSELGQRDGAIGQGSRFYDEGGTAAGSYSNGTQQSAARGSRFESGSPSEFPTPTNQGQGTEWGRGAGSSGSRGSSGSGAGGTSGDATGSGGKGASGAGGGGSQTQQGSQASSAQSFAQSSSLAESRGANWAVPTTAASDVGIRRPIKIICDSQRLLLVPEKGTTKQLQIFRHNGSVSGIVDPFVEAVRERVNGWGIAGQGIFWQPMLQVEMRENADANYQQLLQLLDNSGIEVTREP